MTWYDSVEKAYHMTSKDNTIVEIIRMNAASNVYPHLVPPPQTHTRTHACYARHRD